MTVVAVGVLVWLVVNVAFVLLRWRATADRPRTAPAAARRSGFPSVAPAEPALVDPARAVAVPVPAQTARAGGAAAPASRAAQAVPAQSCRRTGTSTVAG